MTFQPEPCKPVPYPKITKPITGEELSRLHRELGISREVPREESEAMEKAYWDLFR